MQRTFIILPEFDKNWKSMGLSDEDLRRLENLILQNPEAGALMQGTGGLRKLRFALDNRGKSGSARVCYVDFIIQETVFLITAYPKNEKENLSKAERNTIHKLIEALEHTLRS
jgi:hypothetical protein